MPALLLLGCTASTVGPARVSHGGKFHPDPIFEGEIYFEERGPEGAPLVVLLHGLGGSTQDFDGVSRDLERDHRVLALDLPGFGRSSKPDTAYTPRRYVRALAHFLTERAPFHLVGHSLGAAIGLLYAARLPEQVETLVLIDAAGILHGSVLASSVVSEVGPDVERNVLGGLIERLLSESDGSAPQKIVHSPIRRFLMLGSDPNRIAALGLGMENFGPAIDRVRAPALVIWGEKDNIAPLRTGRLLSGRLRNAKLVVLPDVGHVPMTAAPDRTASLIRSFAASRETDARAKTNATPGTERIEIDGAVGRVIEGSYDTIAIKGSSVVIRNATARAIVIDRSQVTIEDTSVSSDDVALAINEARVQATNVDIRGRVAIESGASRIDLAGATLIGSEAAIRGGKRRSSIVLSVSRIKSPKATGWVHSARKVAAGGTL